jgi:hypothetical protein
MTGLENRKCSAYLTKHWGHASCWILKTIVIQNVTSFSLVDIWILMYFRLFYERKQC